MDRDNHWERIKKVYEVMTGESENVKKTAPQALEDGYKKGEGDETIEPSIISLGDKKQFLKDRDSVIIFNFRADRAREITIALGQKKFDKFKKTTDVTDLCLATMTPYETDWKIKISTIFGALEYQNTISDIFSQNKISQLHVAETEKYAHVTYFFNGGREKEAAGEKYLCIPSPRVESYAEKPEMSLHQVVSQLLAEISKNDYQFVVVNFANPDMVGHCGDFEATKKAIAVVDENLRYLISKAKSVGFDIFLTADHGNAEQMINLETGEIDKEHTTNPIFFVRIKEINNEETKFTRDDHKQIWSDLSLDQPKGVLADITPTIAEVLGIEGIEYFSGQSLLNILE
jgi:2,3-bisphosphoglycerate-independent phosphoglycerate mutase